MHLIADGPGWTPGKKAAAAAADWRKGVVSELSRGGKWLVPSGVRVWARPFRTD